MRRNGFTLIEFVVVVAIIGILAAILFPIFGRTRGCNSRRPACQSNLKQIVLGFKQYTADYNEKHPPVAVTRSGYWAGSLQLYVKSWQIFQCPSAPKTKLKTTDYFYNSRLAQVSETRINLPTQIVLLGEGTDNSLTSYALSDLPSVWRDNTVSPAKRHLDGANYAFVDGHVKWLTPDKISANTPANDVYTFAIR